MGYSSICKIVIYCCLSVILGFIRKFNGNGIELGFGFFLIDLDYTSSLTSLGITACLYIIILSKAYKLKLEKAYYNMVGLCINVIM